VRPFPDPGRKWTVSTDGASGVRWSGDGRELFLLGLDERQMMAVPVQTESTFRAGPPRLLFETEYPISYFDWDVTLDGQRFVAVLQDKEQTESNQIVVVPDFASELKQRVHAGRR
jgi:hypothetical protein